jgi:hypothetical protein
MTCVPKEGSYEKGLPQRARESRDLVNIFKRGHSDKSDISMYPPKRFPDAKELNPNGCRSLSAFLIDTVWLRQKALVSRDMD